MPYGKGKKEGGLPHEPEGSPACLLYSPDYALGRTKRSIGVFRA
jgi:hypothetical protein